MSAHDAGLPLDHPRDEASIQEERAELLRVRDLHTLLATPAGPLTIVEDVTFDLARGAALGVVGESGSGKTMLARSIIGLLPRGSQRSGDVTLAERDLTRLDPRALRRVWGRHIAMVSQDPMRALNPSVRVGRQLTEGMRHHLDMGRTDADRAAVDLLRAVRVPEPERAMREYPHRLSGGTNQRISIAAALSCGPDLLIADEPTTALDVTVQAQILDLLTAEQRRRSMAMILITHDLAVVSERTDEVAVMYAGRFVEHAPTHALFARPRMPYTASLLRSIPRLDAPPHARLPVIDGRPPDPTAHPQGCRFAPRCPQVQARCIHDEPPLTEAGDSGHRVRCWFPLDEPTLRVNGGASSGGRRSSNGPRDRNP